MKGDKFKPGEHVYVRRHDGQSFNNKFATVRELIGGTGRDCQPYLVYTEDGVGVLTCACYLDRPEPKLNKELRRPVKWDQCPWRPNAANLTPASQIQIKRWAHKKGFT